MNFPYSLPFVCDGTFSCNELTGDDFDSVCGENIIVQNPEILVSAKQNAVDNGMTSILSPTAGIFHSRLEDLGFDGDFNLFEETITKTCVKVGNGIPVGGVITHKQIGRIENENPAFEDCYFSYLEKMTLLKDSGVSYILLKNHKNLFHMRAGVLSAKTLNLPVFVVTDVDDEGKNDDGTDYIASLITLQALGASAFGIYCKDGIETESELIKKAFPHAEIPLIAVIDTQTESTQQIMGLIENGASVFIDRAKETDRAKIEPIKTACVRYEESSAKDSYAAATEREAFFLPDNLVLSEPIYCGYDMSDELIDFDDENINAVYIELTSADDAEYLADNADMTHLPFVIRSDNPVTLEAVLRCFQGRLIVDTRCEIDEKQLLSVADKYGAILY